MTRPPTTQEDEAGLDGLGVIWDWAVVAQNVPWSCPNLFHVQKPHQEHPPPAPSSWVLGGRDTEMDDLDGVF